ncbi:MAG: hypothetical protein GY754_26730 [bacterium]|nr:hypothetical protein [bacterium]
MSTFFLIAVLAVTGCEAGLVSNDGTENGEDFSFSDLYSNIATLKEEIIFLKNRINQLDGTSGDISNSVQELAVQVANDRDEALSTLYGTVNNDRATALSSLQTTVNSDLSNLQAAVNNDRTIGLNSLHSTITGERTTALNTASTNLIDNEIKRAAPPGTIAPFAGDTIPDGWLLCDGQSYGRTGYSELYQAIGTAWGTPDSASFNVPDLRGIFLRGVDGGVGRDPNAGLRSAMNPGGNTGNAVGSFQLDELMTHSHSTVQMISDHYVDGVDSTTTHSGDHHNQPRPTGSFGGNETRPKNAYVNYIIKY